ncbi:MAG: hypothetical protein IPJ61_17830 [Tessaracoccus sp.]|nr:hypothetical protein [Tessaracoccus sp.]
MLHQRVDGIVVVLMQGAVDRPPHIPADVVVVIANGTTGDHLNVLPAEYAGRTGHGRHLSAPGTRGRRRRRAGGTQMTRCVSGPSPALRRDSRHALATPASSGADDAACLEPGKTARRRPADADHPPIHRNHLLH